MGGGVRKFRTCPQLLGVFLTPSLNLLILLFWLHKTPLVFAKSSDLKIYFVHSLGFRFALKIKKAKNA